MVVVLRLYRLHFRFGDISLGRLHRSRRMREPIVSHIDYARKVFGRGRGGLKRGVKVN